MPNLLNLSRLDDTLGRFSIILLQGKGVIFVTFCLFVFDHQEPYEMSSSLKGKNLLPREHLSPFRVDLFSEVRETKFERVFTHETVSTPLKHYTIFLIVHPVLLHKVMNLVDCPRFSKCSLQ